MGRVAWGAVLLGLLIGLGGTLVLALLSVALPVGSPGRGLLAVLAQFIGQMVAGYAATRLAGGDFIVHGSYGGLAIYLVTTSIALASGGQPAVGSLLLFGLVAAVIGMGGGLLAIRSP